VTISFGVAAQAVSRAKKYEDEELTSDRLPLRSKPAQDSLALVDASYRMQGRSSVTLLRTLGGMEDEE
jgi:hypothetical protein